MPRSTGSVEDKSGYVPTSPGLPSRPVATLLATHFMVQGDAAASYLGHSERTYDDTYVVGETGHHHVNAAISLLKSEETTRKSS